MARLVGAARMLFVFVALLCACNARPPAHVPRRATSAPLVPLHSFAAPVVPQPKHLTAYRGTYGWPGRVRIFGGGAAERAGTRALERFVREQVGTRVTDVGDRGRADVVVVRAHPADAQLGAEGYALSVRPVGIRITANGPAGFDYAVKTLAQLTTRTAGGRLSTPLVSVRDWPSYRWRGIHLDVSRHFFGPATVKRYLDLAERYKLNVFHWHLTDDDAWRIEIARRPRLAAIGGCSPGGRRCAYYTRAQIREIVAYARERQIDIVPEIDVPSHSSAAIRAYPELGCAGAGSSVLCPSEQTYAMLTDVLHDIVELFPGTYVHLGGDEVPPRYAREQRAVTKRLAAYLAAHGRRAVVWDDAVAAGVPPGVLVMAWRGERAVRSAALHGRDVVATPNVPLYFNGPYPNTLRDVYGYDPLAPHAAPGAHRRIIGVQANLWTERIRTPDALFATLLPRELALSEVAWSGSTRPGWRDFRRRLPAQLRRLSAQGYLR